MARWGHWRPLRTSSSGSSTTPTLPIASVAVQQGCLAQDPVEHELAVRVAHPVDADAEQALRRAPDDGAPRGDRQVLLGQLEVEQQRLPVVELRRRAHERA